MYSRRFILLGAALAALLMLGGCGSRAPVGLVEGSTPQPTPTVAQLFAAIPTTTPRPAIMSAPRPTATRAAAPETATAEAQPLPTPNGSDPTAGLDVVSVYKDGLSNSWTLTNSVLIEYVTRSTDYVDEGRYSLEATAVDNFATLYFTVRSDSKEIFASDRVVGLRFRLSGGDAPIGNEELAVTVVGSNRQPYWVKGDTSAQLEGRVTDDQPTFSETRLYFLGINSAIPAGEWTDIIVWLDDLIYDPDYEYVTGFYLKTDGLERFFVDDVMLLVAPEAAGGAGG